MANQACLGVAVAAVFEVGSCITADTFLDDQIYVIRQKTCQGCAFAG